MCSICFIIIFFEVFVMGVVIFILRNKMVLKIFNIELLFMLVVELLCYLIIYSLLNKISLFLVVFLFVKCVLLILGL